jgi:hypothetical protein
MASHILGLLTSKKFADESDRFYNHRRKILHSYPQGGAPLTGLLSMMPEEVTPDTQFYWYEKRYKVPTCDTRGTNPITLDAPSDGDADDGTVATTTQTNATTTDMWLKVNTTVDLRPGIILEVGNDKHQLIVQSVTRGASTTTTNGFAKVTLSVV